MIESRSIPNQEPTPPLPPRVFPDEQIQTAVEQEFECHRCGNCCKGEGAVAVDAARARRMADHLGVEVEDFLKEYTLPVAPGLWWLLDQPNEERWCVFLEQDEEGLYACRVNEVKPEQCRDFPKVWRNEDSFRTCAGLKALMEKLRKRK